MDYSNFADQTMI